MHHYRFAPSPTHFIHEGNAVSACLNFLLAERNHGSFTLRIEDIDTTRCHQHYVQAIYEDLHWLGITWQENVRLQSEYMADYAPAITTLAEQGVLYGCTCSRKQYHHLSAYPQTCRARVINDSFPLHDAIKAGDSIRINADIATKHTKMTFASTIKDDIIRRRDIGTSYHIAVVIDDALQQISHVVRGADLYDSTALHILLQRLLGLPHPTYWHHPLIEIQAGRKLSKADKMEQRIDAKPKQHYWNIANHWLSIMLSSLN